MSTPLFRLEDNFRHKGLRKRLVNIIREKGITDEAVLEAIGSIPRHYFFDPAFVEHAYEDKAFQIGEGQTISQPYTVAYQTQLLEVQRRDKILEVGTGSGYQACILAYMGARVFTIERHKKLYERAKALLEAMHVTNIRFFYGDGFEGLPAFAPFDKILITAAVAEQPVKLLDQLRIGGYLVMPYGKGSVQHMQRIIKIDEGKYEQEQYDTFKFVPMLKGKVW
ncbi:MAG TPA: protein-L-isoaspartate(D-aspartate) O-methyltransferase [Chitinophagales bacterium]|nr:protein-L-isoaspartate(D-aspartate) O-methyltransferase [Chitinophagales bacterium]